MVDVSKNAIIDVKKFIELDNINFLKVTLF